MVKVRKQPPVANTVDSITHQVLNTKLISDPAFLRQQNLWRIWKQMRPSTIYRIQDRVPTIHTDNREIQTCKWIFSQIYKIHSRIYRQICRRIYRQTCRWICKLIFKSGQIYSQIYESRQDLELHKSLLWCCFMLRLQLKEKSIHLWGNL